MQRSRLQKRLEQGDLVSGVFTPAGARLETPGILRWSQESGAEVELVDLSDRWPTGFEESFTVHCLPNEGEALTMLGTRVRQVQQMNLTSRLASANIFLGAHISGEERWPVANYSPATLHEWLPETGLSIDYDPRDRSRVSVTYQAPESRSIRLPGADLNLHPSASWAWSFAPDWTIETALSFSVRSDEPLTVDEYRQQYGGPLLAFSTFAADRPDGILRESYFDPETNAGVVALRYGEKIAQPEWRPVPGRYLFSEADLPDLDRALQRWFELWHKSFPALDLLRRAIAAGNSYDPPRFMNVYTAAEGYWKAAESRRKPWSVKRLLAKTSIPPDTFGIGGNAQGLIGATRKYFAHLESPPHFTAEEIDASAYASTRRLHAMLQACLLSELGFSPNQCEVLIKQHYRNFPIPSPGTDDRDT